MKLAPANQPSRHTRASHYTLIAAICIAAPLVGCGSSNSSNNSGSTNIMLKNENNYSSTSTLALTNVNTVSGQDVEICWGDLLKDLQCHDVAPATDIKNALHDLGSITGTDVDASVIDRIFANFCVGK